jgi:hypothetical protein
MYKSGECKCIFIEFVADFQKSAKGNKVRKIVILFRALLATIETDEKESQKFLIKRWLKVYNIIEVNSFHFLLQIHQNRETKEDSVLM